MATAIQTGAVLPQKRMRIVEIKILAACSVAASGFHHPSSCCHVPLSCADVWSRVWQPAVPINLADYQHQTITARPAPMNIDVHLSPF